MVMVAQATGTHRLLTLRFGNAEFGYYRGSDWDTRSVGGRICIDDSNAPFFSEWMSGTYRHRSPPNSNQM